MGKLLDKDVLSANNADPDQTVPLVYIFLQLKASPAKFKNWEILDQI